MTGALIRDERGQTGGKRGRPPGRGGHLEEEAEAGGMWPKFRSTWSPGSWDTQEGFFLP